MLQILGFLGDGFGVKEKKKGSHGRIVSDRHPLVLYIKSFVASIRRDVSQQDRRTFRGRIGLCLSESFEVSRSNRRSDKIRVYQGGFERELKPI
jgi:hypothetical protein